MNKNKKVEGHKITMKTKILSVFILTAILMGLTACAENLEISETTPTVSETVSETTEEISETTADAKAKEYWETDSECPKELLGEFGDDFNYDLGGFPAYEDAKGTDDEKDRYTLNFWLFYMKMLQSDENIEKWHLVFVDADKDGYYDMIYRPYYETVQNAPSLSPDAPKDYGVQWLLSYGTIIYFAGDNYNFNYNADRSAVLNLTDNEKTSEMLIIGYSNNPYDENGYAIQITDPAEYLRGAPMIYYYSDDCDIPEDERIYSAPFDSEEFIDKYGLDKSLLKDNDTDGYGKYLATPEFAAEYERFADDMKEKYSDNPVLEGVFTADEIASMHVDDFINVLRG